MKIFKTLEDVYACYGEENIIPITNIVQMLFYVRHYNIQPKWIDESSKSKGHVVFYCHKGETNLAYRHWNANRHIGSQSEAI